MANATAKVNKSVVKWTQDLFKRSSKTLAAETTYFTGAMVGTDSTGYLTKFDDTAVLRFAGVVRGKEGDPVLPAGTAGARELDLDYEEPKLLVVAVSGVAVTDIGRRVYASDDQTGTLTPTTYGNVIGTVEDLVPGSTGLAFVRPIYAVPSGDNLQVMAADGAIQVRAGTVLVTKAGVAALTIADPTTGVHDGMEITILSTTANAHTVTRATTGFNDAGASGDVATFGAAKGNSMTIVAYAGKWYAKSLTGVTLA